MRESEGKAIKIDIERDRERENKRELKRVADVEHRQVDNVRKKN